MSEVPFFVPDGEVASRSRMADFQRFCEGRLGRPFSGWLDFHAWSVRDFRVFWRWLLEWAGLDVEGEADPVCVGDECERARFFPGLRLNYAASVLAGAGVGDDHPAVIAEDETGRLERLTFGDLRERVGRVAAGLRGLGIGPGERVVAVARNDERAVIACLAATGLGAAWSSVPPDLGSDAVLARFRPLEPSVLFAHGHSYYQGVRRPLRERLAGLVAALPSLRTIVSLDGDTAAVDGLGLPVTTLAGLASMSLRPGGQEEGGSWRRFPFDHPLFILFSSGTTGLPKCIVHGAGGTLIEHVKEHRLHSDFGPRDTLFFHTSTGWMMWNWQLSALASGTTVVLWDGSATYPEPDQLWRVVSRHRVTVFGTSPAYLQYCRDAGISPRERVDLAALRAVQSTGSILFEPLYDFVRDHVKDVLVQSISGGTDIIGCFVLGHPGLPVWRGESQCVSLGLDVREQRDPAGGPAELVCANPFPSRPVGFFGDPDGSRFHEAYFAKNPGVWTHGDFVRIHPRGSVRILGRSDGVLNVRGIRIGPAEIYAILQDFPEIKNALAVEQEDPRSPGGSRLVLLVVLAPRAVLDRPLTLRIKKALAQRASMNHVPDVVADVPDLPVTHSGKLSERAAREAANGRVPANLAALRNPECIEAIRSHPALARPRPG